MDAATAQLVRQLQQLYTPAVSDTLDAVGLRRQVLAPEIRPLKPSFRFVGPALTARAERYPEYTTKPLASWARIFVKMLDAARPGDVFVVNAERAPNIATWGELMSTAARARGALGAVTDGAVRDTPKILAMRPPFPVFGRNYTPYDAKGRLEFTEFNRPLTCAGVSVRPGDIVFGDLDGVVVIPRNEAKRVVAMARERAEREGAMRRALREGVRMGTAFRRYQTL